MCWMIFLPTNSSYGVAALPKPDVLFVRINSDSLRDTSTSTLEDSYLPLCIEDLTRCALYEFMQNLYFIWGYKVCDTC